MLIESKLKLAGIEANNYSHYNQVFIVVRDGEDYLAGTKVTLVITDQRVSDQKGKHYWLKNGRAITKTIRFDEYNEPYVYAFDSIRYLSDFIQVNLYEDKDILLEYIEPPRKTYEFKTKWFFLAMQNSLKIDGYSLDDYEENAGTEKWIKWNKENGLIEEIVTLKYIGE